MSLQRLLVSCALPLFLAPLATASCYWPDHSQIPSGSEYEPCNSIVGTTSMCCATHRTTPAGANAPGGEYTRDNCLPNGLCQNIWRDGKNNLLYTYFRVACSSKDWGPECLPYVCNSTASYSTEVTHCDPTYDATKWCCGSNNTECCADWDHQPNAVSIPLVLSQAAISTSSNQTSSKNTTSTSHNGGLSSGAKAGVGVGAAIGGLLLFGLGYMAASMIEKRRSQKGANEYQRQEQVLQEQVLEQQRAGLLAYGRDYGTPANHQIHEVAYAPFAAEMPSK